ncbi:MAG: TolB protein [Gaiellaceae bacterium]|jgi:Tol biopolymer transport system component|nr:TolB protein [Gaiellaceae bacterium]
MSRRLLFAAVVLLLPVVAGTSHAATTTTYSPCQQVILPTWSPDGTQIVYYGRRWPTPTGGGNPNSILQAYCTMDADGTNIQPLAHTVCNVNCQDPPSQIEWVKADEILWLVDGGPIYRTTPGSEPTLLTTINDTSFAINAAKTRIASGPNFPGCVTCSGPVRVTSLATGRRVGFVGGSKFDNMWPSLSPDGTRVVFERDPATDTGQALGLWTAHANGTDVRQIARVGFQPLWSPVNNRIAYVRWAGSSVALRVKWAAGGRGRTLVAKNVLTVFGWSPDGKYIAFESGTGTLGTLSVVDVVTGQVRHLLPMKYGPTAEWSPDSQELLANYNAPKTKCWWTYRVPVNGAPATKISSCS